MRLDYFVARELFHGLEKIPAQALTVRDADGV